MVMSPLWGHSSHPFCLNSNWRHIATRFLNFSTRELSQLDSLYLERMFQCLITGAEPYRWSLHVTRHVITGKKGIIIEKQGVFSHNTSENLCPLSFMTCKVWKPRSSKASSESEPWNTSMGKTRSPLVLSLLFSKNGLTDWRNSCSTAQFALILLASNFFFCKAHIIWCQKTCAYTLTSRLTAV